MSFKISILAPRGGSDRLWTQAIGEPQDFNPRSPWGERRLAACTSVRMVTFQSSLPVGGATPFGGGAHDTSTISILAPRGGSDVSIYICPLIP